MISPDQTSVLFAIIAVCAAFGYWIDNTRWGKRVPGILVSILIPMGLTSTGLIPSAAPLYDNLGAVLVPLSIPLLLFQAHLRRIFRVAGPMILIFFLGTAATLIGVFVGVGVLDLGPDAASIAAVLAASDIGGSSNLVAVSQIVEWSDPSSLSIAFAADALAGTTYWVILLLVPTIPLVRRLYPSPIMDQVALQSSAVERAAPPSASAHMLLAFAASATIVAGATLLARYFQIQHQTILVISAIALVVANLTPQFFRDGRSAEEAGLVLIYLFMPVIGAYTDLRALSDTSLSIVAFSMTIIFTHLGLLGAAAYVLKLDLAETVVASCAVILGGPSTTATAATFDWRQLIAPGFMCALLGNAIANFIGVAVYQILK